MDCNKKTSNTEGLKGKQDVKDNQIYDNLEG